MVFHKKYAVRLGLCAAGLTAVLINFQLSHRKSSSGVPVLAAEPQAQAVPIGAAGYAAYDTKGTVPGNPDQTIRDMQRLYQILGVYQRLHNGALPDRQKKQSLVSDIVLHAKEYGFTTGDQMKAFFQNPDMKYADARQNDAHPETVFPYLILSTRPDGTPVGGPKAPGTRDALAYTDMYFHKNIRTFKGDRTTTKPVGFYLVLWDDGQVQKIPFQDMRFVSPQPKGNGGFTQTFVFPGQAGAPSETLSRAEYDEWLHKHI